MDTPRHIGTMVVVRNPPHVTVRPTLQPREASLRKLLRASAVGDICHHRFWHHLLRTHTTFVAHHFAETGHVTQSGVQTATGKFGPDGIDGEIGILLHAQFAPDALREHFAHGLACDTRNHPSHHVRIDGFVGKGLAVFAFFLNRE